jgi:hypothetical protein
LLALENFGYRCRPSFLCGGLLALQFLVPLRVLTPQTFISSFKPASGTVGTRLLIR